MSASALHFVARPEVENARLVMGFAGWMDGGEVSTGTIEHLIEALEAKLVATIDPDSFYVYNMPGSMEISALFRPHTRIEDGIVQECEIPSNELYLAEQHDLLIFKGKEPNLRWPTFAEHIFEIVEAFKVGRVHFAGSFSGAVPHTREPRVYTTISHEALRPLITTAGLRPANYEGPGSFMVLLATMAMERGVEVLSLVTEVPAYVQGRNARCIETMVRLLSGLMRVPVELDELRKHSNAFTSKLDETMRDQENIVELVKKLERQYDDDVFGAAIDDPKDWLESQGIRLD